MDRDTTLIIYAAVVSGAIGLGIVYLMKERQKERRRRLLSPPLGVRTMTHIPGRRLDHQRQRLLPPRQLLFEPQDLSFYMNQRRWEPNYLDFDFNEDEVEIYDPDSQNVHDSLVQRAIRQKFDEISSCGPSITSGNSTEGGGGVIQHLMSMASALPLPRRTAIQETLKTIQERDTTIVNLENKTEQEVLSTVYHALPAKDHDELLKQIEDCVENGKVVCPTGVATRLMNTLFLRDPESRPRTKAHIRSELLSKAAVIRQQYQDEDSPSFLSRLSSLFTSEYDGVLTPEEVNTELNTWGSDL